MLGWEFPLPPQPNQKQVRLPLVLSLLSDLSFICNPCYTCDTSASLLQDLSDVAFRSGEKIYGRVDTRQLQDDTPFDVLVEKVFTD